MNNRGFSMVEVALALGIVAFAFLGLLALLPLGVKTNQVSAEETRAAWVLTAVEADLRNSYPDGKSLLFGLPLPYAVSADGRMVLNPSLTVGERHTVGLNDAEEPVSLAERRRYQVSVVYTFIPNANELRPAQARLVVNWPSLPEGEVARRGNVDGLVETVVSFPVP